MNVFEDELKKGKFVVGQCLKCQKISWPPNDFCSHCFGSLSWRSVIEPGILVEYSMLDGKLFCIAEFENTIRIMGIFSGNTTPKPGQKVRIVRCTFDGAPKITFE
jgi:hypothetical protein